MKRIIPTGTKVAVQGEDKLIPDYETRQVLAVPANAEDKGECLRFPVGKFTVVVLKSDVREKPCDRCNGSMYLPHYSHVQGGKCFKCGPILD